VYLSVGRNLSEGRAYYIEQLGTKPSRCQDRLVPVYCIRRATHMQALAFHSLDPGPFCERTWNGCHGIPIPRII
jgi:hypothetical protein